MSKVEETADILDLWSERDLNPGGSTLTSRFEVRRPNKLGLDKFCLENGLFCLPATLIKIAYSALCSCDLFKFEVVLQFAEGTSKRHFFLHKHLMDIDTYVFI